MIRQAERGAQSQGRPKFGLLEDDELVKRIEKIQNDSKAYPLREDGSHPLLDDGTLGGLALTMNQDFADQLTQLKKLGLESADFDPRWVYFPINMTDAAQETARRTMIELGEARAPIVGGTRRGAITQRFFMHRQTNRSKWPMYDLETEEALMWTNPTTGIREHYHETVWEGQLRPGGTQRTSIHQVIHGDPLDRIEQSRLIHLKKNHHLRRVGDPHPPANDSKAYPLREDGSHPLLDDGTLGGLALTMNQDFADQLTQLKKLGLESADFDPRWVYFPINMTDAAQETARRTMIELGEARAPIVGGTRRGAITQRFFMHRQTNRSKWPMYDLETEEALMWTNPTTGIREHYHETVWEGQLRPGGTQRTSIHQVIHGDPLDRIEQSRLIHLKKNPHLRRVGDHYDLGEPNGALKGQRWLPEVHPTSPQHLNEHRADYMRKVGDEFSGPIFEEDPIAFMSQRMGMQLESVAGDNFRRVMKPQIRLLDQREFQQAPRGLAAGTKDIGGVDMRPIRPEFVRDKAIRLPLGDTPEGMIQVWPEEIATELENYVKTFSADENINAVLKFGDNVTGLWKFSVLYLPRWFMVNVIGTSMLGLLAGSNPSKWMPIASKIWRDVFRVHGLHPGQLGLGTIDIAGETLSILDLMKQGTGDRILNSGRVMQEILTPLRIASGEAKGLARLVNSHHSAIRGLGYWFKFNAAIEDLMRMTVWIELRNAGNARPFASNQVARYLFDYGDLSYIEKRWGTRLWPFYRWMRNNGALQMKMLLQRPAYAAAYPKLLNTLQEAFEDESTLPVHLQPRWLRDQFAIHIASHQDEATFLAVSSLTPAQELAEIGQAVMGGEGFTDFLRYFLSGINPLVRNLGELAIGSDMFSRRKIGPREEGGAFTAPEYLFRQTGLIYELTRIKSAFQGEKGDDEVDWFGGAARSIIGGRVQKQQLESLIRTKRYEAGESASRIRFAIRKSIEEGDQDEARRLSLKYVELHRELWDVGLREMVPKALRRMFRQQDGQKRRLRAIGSQS